MGQFVLNRSQNPTSEAERNAALADPGFGRFYTDHMAVMNYTEGQGWHDPRLIATEDFSLHPAAAVLHYGQEIFEGLKAYRREDDSIWLFRPERNARRFMGSAERLEMAVLPEETFLNAVTELVELEQNWVPEGVNEQSLYIRPYMIADEPYLGVREAHRYIFAVIATPAGAYYPEPVKLWITPNFTRAAKGGTGAAKCGGNYAASLAAANEAAKHGCGQVLYTDGAEHKWLEECGTMNFMLVTADGQLVTPALGSILDGVTRNSILALATDHGLKPVERPVSIDEMWEGLDSGHITETFACGTAAVITPIVGFNSPDRGEEAVGDGTPGVKTREIREHLLEIQYGRAEDKHGWMRRVV
ncbi:branched-chain amino acid aminotransferase [Tessaracoccus rhinocerotis]|uniref:branched-chain-amino-acid transaminase n=1 Tax=Tessaracoccus rhinocerotis TaxID=1689449 RepID=A0A553JX88_9ACTN|nr:branched-chain amino acid aminotransferase [Tessaracoccus rhinocerotis]TRY17079.1 branched-chain amino acid aminotransferase [Tessaracoccus rhinocerotis]